MNPLKLAIIGGGPSAFYVASRILKLQPEAQNLRIHMFDRLWAPHGLVRYGVAPDHPEVKNCTHKFDQAATDPRLSFFGNVDIVSSPISSPSIPHSFPLPLSSIFSNYTHVLFATGCTLPTLHPDLPPSQYCVPALNLVHWYTQHPNAPPPPALDKVQHVSIIGMGNVSLDVARMLLTSVDVLKKYDVPQKVLDVLAQSTVKHVSIIGRRGPLEAAFTVKELREMINLPEASMVPLDKTLLTPPSSSDSSSASALKTQLTRQQSRVLQLLEKGSKNAFGSTPKTWSLDFFRSPIGLVPTSPSAPSSRAQLSLAHTSLDPTTHRAVPTSTTSTIPTDLVITSLGFHAEPTLSFYDPGLRHLRNVGGRVVSSNGVVLKGVYASGWAAVGARGVLASTMVDAYSVAERIIGDWKEAASDSEFSLSSSADTSPDSATSTPTSAPTLPLESSDSQRDAQVHSLPHLLTQAADLDAPPAEVQQGLAEGRITTYGDWKEVDAEEVRRGEVLGKERERMGWEEARAFLKKD